MNWRFIKAFPKWAIALALLIISTALFAGWWMMRGVSTPQARGNVVVIRPDTTRAEIQKKVASLPAKLGWLALVGNDLYDISTGELIFQNWLKGVPQRLFYQKETNRLMALTERGVIRSALDGTKDGFLGDEAAPPAFTHDGKQAMFVRNGDVWIADVDWRGFRFTNERQATKLGQFNAAFFAANVMMGSSKAIIVRNQNRLLKVNLLTGDVQPVKLPLGDLAKRRSPDSRFIVGDEPRNIYAIDVEAADAYNFPSKAERLLDFLWLGNDQCAFIVGGKGIGLYNRRRNAIEEVTALPFPCNKLVAPSPGGRYAICYGAGGMLIIDFKERRTIPFGAPVQDLNWVDDETLILSRDVPDMSVRGTWLKTIGGAERRELDQPYNAGRGDAAAFTLMREVNLILIASGTELYRMKFDGSEVRQVAKLPAPVLRIQAVETWGK